MIAINMEMPKSCCEFHKDTGMVLHCSFYNCCDKRTTIKVNFKPIDCPLIEIVACKDCKYNAYETKIKGDESIKIFCRKNKTYRCIDGFCSDGKRREEMKEYIEKSIVERMLWAVIMSKDERTIEEMLEDAPIVNAIPIPDNATIGDIIEPMLPNAEVNPNPYIPSVDVYMGGILMMRMDRNLWNAPYKKEEI